MLTATRSYVRVGGVRVERSEDEFLLKVRRESRDNTTTRCYDDDDWRDGILGGR